MAEPEKLDNVGVKGRNWKDHELYRKPPDDAKDSEIPPKLPEL